MKRQKQKIKTKSKKKTIDKAPKQSISFFDKYIAPYNIWVILALIIAISVVAFTNYFTTDFLFFFKDIGSDSINQDFPASIHKTELFRQALINKWTFYKGMGEPYYTPLPTEPFAWIKFSLQNVGMSIWGADYLIYSRFFNVFLLNSILSGIFFYYYLRLLSVSKFAATTGAITMAFSGYMVVASGWGFSTHVFMATFLLFSFEQLYIKKRWYFFPIAVIILSKNPFVLYLYSFFLLIYSIFRYTWNEEGNIKGFLKLTGSMVGLGIAGLLINFVHFSKNLIGMYLSPRVSGSASYSKILESGNAIIDTAGRKSSMLMRFFSSDILGTGSNFKGWSNYLESPLFYIGILTLILFPQVFGYLNKRKKIIFGSFFGFWTLTLIIPKLRYAILAFTGDYFRYGFDFFIPFVLLLFSVIALSELNDKLKINYKILAGTVVFWLVILFFPYNSIAEGSIDNDLRKLIVFLIIAYSGLLILMTKPEYKSHAQIAMIVMLIFELGYFSHKSYAGRVPLSSQEFKINSAGYNDGTSQAVEYIKQIEKSKFYRTEKDYQSGNAQHGSLNDALAQKYYGTTRYASFNQINYIRFLEEMELIQKGDENATRWVRGLRGIPLLQTFGNVKYSLSKTKITKNTKPQLLNSGYDFVAEKAGISILKNRYSLPFGYTYDKYIEPSEIKKLIAYKIDPRLLVTIRTELLYSGAGKNADKIVNSLKPIVSKKYTNKANFEQAIKTNIGEVNYERYKFQILKHSTITIKEQIALLNAFVYEKDFNKNININDFKKATASDSNINVKQFNFKIYKELVENLKEDTLQITEFSQSNIKGKINLSKHKLLFFTIPFDEGWKIKVNNKNAELSRVNYGFTGISLPPGNYDIELYYVPKFSIISSWVSIIASLLFWSLVILDILRKRKKKKL